MLKTLATLLRIVEYYRRKRQAEQAEPEETAKRPSELKELMRSIKEASLSIDWGPFSRNIRRSPYVYLFHPDASGAPPEEIRRAFWELHEILEDRETWPFAAKLAYVLYKEGLIDKFAVRLVAHDIGPIIEAVALLRGAKDVDDLLQNPEVFDEIIDISKKLKARMPTNIEGVTLNSIADLKKILPIEAPYATGLVLREEDVAKLRRAVWAYAYRHFGKKRLTSDGLRAVPLAEDLRPLLEKIQKLAKGDTPPKQVLREIQEERKILEDALLKWPEWAKGSGEPVKGIDRELLEFVEIEEDLRELGLPGILEHLHQKILRKEIDSLDAYHRLAALHTAYALAERRITKFLEKAGFSRVRPTKKILELAIVRPLLKLLEWLQTYEKDPSQKPPSTVKPRIFKYVKEDLDALLSGPRVHPDTLKRFLQKIRNNRILLEEAIDLAATRWVNGKFDPLPKAQELFGDVERSYNEETVYDRAFKIRSYDKTVYTLADIERLRRLSEKGLLYPEDVLHMLISVYAPLRIAEEKIAEVVNKIAEDGGPARTSISSDQLQRHIEHNRLANLHEKVQAYIRAKEILY